VFDLARLCVRAEAFDLAGQRRELTGDVPS
jgi:hypothetical protein